MVVTRSSTYGPAARPVAIPTEPPEAWAAVTNGRVTLRRSLWWTGEDRVFDLDLERDQVALYEIVLTEGNEQDVLEHVNFDRLVALWPRLWLARPVRAAWEEWFAEHGGVPTNAD